MKNNKKYFIGGTIAIILIIVLTFLVKPDLFKNDKKDTKEKKDTQEVTKKKITPLIYKVTKDGSDTTIYLFGSIHVADVNNYEFPKYFDEAFNSSDYVTCEYDSTKETDEVKEMLGQIYLDDTTLKDHVSSDSYEKIKNFFEENGENIKDYEDYKLSAILSQMQFFLIQKLNLKIEVGIDDYIINKAKTAGKEVLEVESEEFQDNFLSNVSERVYEIGIVETIDHFDDEVEKTRKLIESWETGYEEGLLDETISASDEEKYSKDDIELVKEFNKNLFDDRNITMTEKFEQYFNDNKNTFFMVGAGHIVGENGIANLLRQKGYIVEKLK